MTDKSGRVEENTDMSKNVKKTLTFLSDLFLDEGVQEFTEGRRVRHIKKMDQELPK